MAELTPDQRNYLYLVEAERVGIHSPILAALYEAQGKPTLSDGETGLGISPVNQIDPAELNTFPEQVQFAANTLRSLTDSLSVQGRQATDLWNSDKGRYTDEFIRIVADGYLPSATDRSAARLEVCDPKTLLAAYLKDLEFEYQAGELPQNLAYLDRALLELIDRIPSYYSGFPHQRDAILEAVRIWRNLDTDEEAMVSLLASGTDEVNPHAIDPAELDVMLKQFVQRISPNYSGFPQQREALLRLTQLWRQLPTRSQAIASLETNQSAATALDAIDPALVAFVQRVPQYYRNRANQRNAMMEAFRLWRQLDSRASATAALGIDPQVLKASTSDREALTAIAEQLDQGLVEFAKRLPAAYEEQTHQRESLIRLVQLWRGLSTRNQAIQSLVDDLKRMERARRDSQDAPPKPLPQPVPPRPSRWTPSNIQLDVAIVPNGNFTWAEATHGGQRIPTNQTTVDAIIRIARLAQQARDRVGRPFRVTSWYRPPAINRAVGGVSNSRHIVGDAIDFTVEGLSGNQLYWHLDPWWPGGLGRYVRFPNLCHIDARPKRARWRN